MTGRRPGPAVNQRAVKTEESHRELLAYELEASEATPERRRRSWSAAGAVGVALLLVLGGIAIGVFVRNRDVDDQRRRAAGAEQQVSSLRQTVEQQQAALDDQQRQIDHDQEQQARLRQSIARQARAPRLPAVTNAASFDDGIYQVRVAIQPGRYHTDGSDSCYWAKLSTGDTNRIIVNNIGSGPQTVAVDSPYFESEGCGTWAKVG